jgi:hypothetical protein
MFMYTIYNVYKVHVCRFDMRPSRPVVSQYVLSSNVNKCENTTVSTKCNNLIHIIHIHIYTHIFRVFVRLSQGYTNCIFV